MPRPQSLVNLRGNMRCRVCNSNNIDGHVHGLIKAGHVVKCEFCFVQMVLIPAKAARTVGTVNADGNEDE